MQPPTGAPRAGDPLRGLTAEQLSAFATGKLEFRNRETPAAGLGPIFNDVSCFACHSAPASGGTSNITVTRFGRTTAGVFDPLTELGGSLLQRRSLTPALREIVPLEGNTVARRQTTPLWGLGLVEAITDDTILALAARRAVDGVTGRAAVITDIVSGTERVGRFGWKNQHASLLGFCADAYANEMGVTNRFFPVENAPNGKTALIEALHLPAGPEDIEDEDSGKTDFELVNDFIRFLAPLPRPASTVAAERGRAVFHQTGCAVCHVPVLMTGASDVAAIANKPVPLFSDLLLHDMGTLGDGIAQAAAGPREFRTAPLWGLRASGLLLHDGRARSVDQAIRMHEGQGAVSRDRYVQLTAAERLDLLAFLNTL
jgi:CxxC motif-containing protein (DUF1111 family)